MPCKCSGLRVDKCKCRLVRAGYPWRRDDANLVLLAHASGTYCPRDAAVSSKPKPNMLIRILEHLYDKCAGYNLRYCPFRGYVKNDRYISNTLKDLLILACFLVANLVVLLAILTKTSVHIYYVLRQAVQWVKSYLTPKMVEDSPVVASKPSISHNYSPPLTYKFI